MDIVEIPVHSDGQPCALAQEALGCPRAHRYLTHTADCYAHALGSAVENWRDALLHAEVPTSGPLSWAALLITEDSAGCHCAGEPPRRPTALGHAILAALTEPQPRRRDLGSAG